jgi:lipoprotein NlpI
MSNRGFALFSAGEGDRAFVDFDQAIELDPHLALAFRTRGGAAFCNRRFAQARKDCAEAARLDPKDCHSLFWLYLANVRDGLINPTQLEEQAAGRDLAKWPGPASEFLLGSLTREALLAASNNENPYKEREQSCTAHFAIGQAELLNGHLAEAADSFRNAIASGATNCFEYVAAERELQELK